MDFLNTMQGVLSLVVGAFAAFLLLTFMQRANGKHTRIFLALLMAQMMLTYIPNGIALVFGADRFTREIVYTQSLLIAVIAVSFGLYYMFLKED